MIVKKASGQICKECGVFSKKFVICEVCHKKICLDCTGNHNYCTEHLLTTNKASIVDDYFVEKYGVMANEL